MYLFAVVTAGDEFPKNYALAKTRQFRKTSNSGIAELKALVLSIDYFSRCLS